MPSNEEPLVCAIMLTAGRPELARRALECFRRQTYQNRKILIVFREGGDLRGFFPSPESVDAIGPVIQFARAGATIGEIRAAAVHQAGKMTPKPEILIHWDDDDWSHPNRIAEQVAQLESTGAAAVGYTEMLFWRSSKGSVWAWGDAPEYEAGEAWIFRGPTPLGTSLCYRADVAAAHPFPFTSYGEDTAWIRTLRAAKCKIEARAAFGNALAVSQSAAVSWKEPRMIARIHAGNSSNAYTPQAIQHAPQHWRRAPEWDAYTRKVMEG